MSYKQHFSRALGAAPGRLHLAAHSHHLWPDVSFEAHDRAWLDAARLADGKWRAIFEELVPRAQAHVAGRLGLRGSSSIAFAPNTHSLLLRILSCLPFDRPLEVLTTGSEFHSFSRQALRLEEDGLLRVERVPVQPFETFVERFARAAAAGRYDLVYLSHVFYDSGWVVPDLGAIVRAVSADETFVVIDGYHAFMALPVDLSELSSRVFYLAGGYKYAMSGEGCCFLHAPDGYGERPRDTGWFAAFGALSGSSAERVGYGPGGARFFGATFDPTALYRFDAVMTWLDAEGIGPETIHAHAHELQELFVAELDRGGSPLGSPELVVPLSCPDRGQFLAFELERAGELEAELAARNIVTDVRGNRLRVGFGLYHDRQDVLTAVERLRSLAKTSLEP